MAIEHWELKRELVRIHLGHRRVNDVVHEYFSENELRLDQGGDDPRGKLLNLWGRWGKIAGLPSPRYALFLEWISRKLPVDETVFGQSIMRDPIGKFFDRLP